MQTMHPTLLIGPADWNPAHMPQADYRARIEALLSSAQAVGAVVSGNSFDHAALAYLTGFTPKLDEGMALIPRNGNPRQLVRGSVNMIAAARPLTWIDGIEPLREPGKAVAEWVRALPAGRVLLIGGDAMPFSMRRAIDNALADIDVEDATARLQAQMLRKTPRELGLLREACRGLATAVAALRVAQSAGENVTAALLAAEHAADKWGAQDVRSLFSLDAGHTLQPFDVLVERKVEPLQVYLAVRHAGYWAEGFVRLAHGEDALQARANEILATMLAAVKPGVSSRDLAQIAARAPGALPAHPIVDPVFGNAIGLALQEPPLLSVDDGSLEAGAVYSLRAGQRDVHAGAIVSAMLHVTDSGCDVLWRGDRPA